MKRAVLILIVFLAFGQAFSQVQVGVYHSGIGAQIGVGTNIEKKFYGELRFLASDRLELDFGAEAIGQYNFHRSEWYNLHGGLMVGYYGLGVVGLPLGATIKPISAFRRFGILMEATPYVLGGEFFLRGNLGLRLRLGGD
jgi:hypothetical protein